MKKEDSMSTSSVATKPMPFLQMPKDGNKKKKYDHEYNSPFEYPTEGKKWKMFSVCSETFNKFETGRFKFERWAKYLNLEDETEKAVYDYATANRQKIVVLQCSDTGALRAIRRFDRE